MSSTHYLACDLGAESGRVILGTLNEGHLTLQEIHRFPSAFLYLEGAWRWNVIAIFEELKTGIQKAVAKQPGITSLSVDSWGVDYVYFRSGEPLLGLPYHYRDTRTDLPYTGTLASDAELIFAETGIQFMSLNTLYQFLDDLTHREFILAGADKFLNIADYLNYLFSGVPRAEQSLASTTQIYNPVSGGWSKKLIAHYGFREPLFPEIVPSGTVLGPVRKELKIDPNIAVVASCSHDTAASVAAVPVVEAGAGDDWAYLSSGTWSLLGVELDQPLINSAVRRANFTNEVGLGNTIRFLKNIVGLWIVQESRRNWKLLGQDFSYDDITREATAAEPLPSLIYPNDDRFLRPGEMLAKVQDFCRETHQPVPESVGQIARTIYESLALLYATTLDQLEELTGRKIRTLHIVGGGGQSALLNQFTANATGRTVVAGPVEATAIGNVLVQAMATGAVQSHAELRKIVAASFPLQTFQPEPSAAWQEARMRFQKFSA